MFGLAVANIRHRYVRTVVTLFSVAIAAALATVTLSASEVVKRSLDPFKRPILYTVSPVFGAPLPFAFVDKIRRLPGVKGQLEWQRTFGLNDPQDHTRFLIWGASNGFPATHAPAVFELPGAVEQRWIADKQGVLLVGHIAEKMGWHEGQSVVLRTAYGAEVSANVSGVLAGHLDDYAILHWEYADQTLARQLPGKVQRILTPYDPAEVGTLRTEIDGLFQNSAEPTLTVPQYNYFHSMSRSISAVPDLLSKIGLVVLIITVLTCSSTVSMSLRERAPELGALRVIGFTRARILALIVGESVCLAGLGGLAGSGLLFALYSRGGLRLRSGTGPLQDIGVSGHSVLLCLLGALVLGVVVVILPGVRAAQRSPLSALQGH